MMDIGEELLNLSESMSPEPPSSTPIRIGLARKKPPIVWCLIFWLEEKKVSREKKSLVQHPEPLEGGMYDVKYGGKTYKGKVLKISEDKDYLDEEMMTVLFSLEEADKKRQLASVDGTAEVALSPGRDDLSATESTEEPVVQRKRPKKKKCPPTTESTGVEQVEPLKKTKKRTATTESTGVEQVEPLKKTKKRTATTEPSGGRQPKTKKKPTAATSKRNQVQAEILETAHKAAALIAEADVFVVPEDQEEDYAVVVPFDAEAAEMDVVMVTENLDDEEDAIFGPPILPLTEWRCQRCLQLEEEIEDLKKKLKAKNAVPVLPPDSELTIPVFGEPSVSVSTISVNWTRVDGSQGYRIAIGEAEAVSLSSVILSHTFEGLESGEDYTITLRAFDAGKKSQPATKKLATAKPRAGRMSAALAEKFKMVELVEGSGVYLYPAQDTIVRASQKDGQSLSYLVATLFTKAELIVSNLLGHNGRTPLDKEILGAISAYQLRKHKVPDKKTRRLIGQKCQDTRQGSGLVKRKKPTRISREFILSEPESDED